MSSIAELLRTRLVQLEFHGTLVSPGTEPNIQVAEALWNSFHVFADLRRNLLTGELTVARCTPSERDVLRQLSGLGLVEVHGGRATTISDAARQYLAGRWLEDLVGDLAKEGNADEVRVGQRVIWRSSFGGSEHVNEIDVIIRVGEKLAFISCKAMRPEALETEAGPDRLFAAILEARYWAEHFGPPGTQAALVTTADLYDEAEGAFRDPALAERAKVLDVRVISADVGSVESLAGSIAHLVRMLPVS
jgi:hypothetical protein